MYPAGPEPFWFRAGGAWALGVGIEAEEVAKGLDGDDGAGDGILLRHRLLKKELQGFPGAATQIGKKIPVPRSGRGRAPRK